MSGERIILALDTASAPGGVAVGAGGAVSAEIVLGVAVRHSELVLPAIDFALRAAGATLADVDAVVCGAGPGSFTGVRIAAATAKGLAHARGVPLFTFSSLLAAAAAASSTAGIASTAGPVCALFDARRGEAYAGCWTVTDQVIETLMEPMAGDIDDIVARLAHHDPLYVGDGAWRNRARIDAVGGRIARVGATAGCAAALLRLHAVSHDAAPVDAAHWEPSYIRAPNVTVPRALRGAATER